MMGRREEALMRALIEGLALPDAARRARLPQSRAVQFLESVARFARSAGPGMEFAPQGRGRPADDSVQSDELIVQTDGASLGNPGPAGAGGVIATPDGEVLEEFHEHIGTATNNVAEYEAVRIGLAKAVGHGARRVTVRLDSELVANQLRGTYKVKDRKLIDAYLRVEAVISELDGVTFEAIPREENVRADRLAQMGARREQS